LYDVPRRRHHSTVQELIGARIDCPPLSTTRVTIYARTLHRACEVLGGLEPLSRHLNVPAGTLARWIGGLDQPPIDVFLAAVDIVLLAAQPGAGTG